MLRQFTLFLFALPFAGTASADWLEASSDHFVIYGDHKEKAAREFAERLERFNGAMARVYRHEQSKPSPSNRVTVYVVDSAKDVREVTAQKNRYVAGVYIPRAGGSVAVIPKLKGASSTYELSGETILGFVDSAREVHAVRRHAGLAAKLVHEFNANEPDCNTRRSKVPG
ncbi:MAG: hypothetical protein ACT4O5_07675 [Gammaproteobacteria bacterium]